MKKFLALTLALLMMTALLSACDDSPADGIARGVTEGSLYKNESLGITYRLPSGWRFYTDVEIAQTMNVAIDQFRDPSLFQSEEVGSVIDFMALQTETGNNINMAVENLGMINALTMTEEEYAERLKTLLAEQLPAYQYTFSGGDNVKLGNFDYYKITAYCRYQSGYSEVHMFQHIYLRKVDTHMIAITATSVDGTVASVFEAMFE